MCVCVIKGYRITTVHPVLVDELVMTFTGWHRLAGVKTSSGKKKGLSPSILFWHMASVNNTFKGLKRFVFLFSAVKQSFVEVFTSMLYA